MELPRIPRNLLTGARSFVSECLKYMEANRPIDGPGIRFNEMPHGRQGVVDPALFGKTLTVDYWENGILKQKQVLVP